MTTATKKQTIKRAKKPLDGKQDNNFFQPGFTVGASSYPNYRYSIIDAINASSISYNITMSIGNSNVVVSSFINLLSGALQRLSVVDDDDNEILGGVAMKMIDQALTIFGNKKSMREYVFHTILSFVCAGMKVSAPTVVDDKGYAQKISVLDVRQVSIQRIGQDEIVSYGGKVLKSYEKFIVKPSINRKGYGECRFTASIKDAMLNGGILDTALAHYDNNADPSTIHILGGDNVQITQDVAKEYERKLKEKYQGTDKSGLPLASNIIKDVKVIDASNSIIKSIDQRLYSSKVLSMQFNIDMRGLGWMRDGGSQAEMSEVYNQVNSVIDTRNELLSESLTNEFNELVADTGKYRFKFIPKYFSSKQMLIDNCFTAKEKGFAIDEEWVLNLLYNS